MSDWILGFAQRRSECLVQMRALRSVASLKPKESAILVEHDIEREYEEAET